MSEKKTTSKKVHTLTLEDQTKLAQANVKKMEQGKIEVMKVVEGVQGAEKLAELIERGKKNGKLSSSELMDVLENLDLESDQMDKIYDTLENLGIDTVGDDYLPELADDIMPPLEELNEIEELPEEEMVDPNTLVDSFGIDDPVRMYLKEIGKVNLLTPDEEVQLAQDMGAGDAAKEQMEELEQARREAEAEVREAALEAESARRELLEKKDYRGALKILDPYKDINSAITLMSLGYDKQAYEIMVTTPDTPQRNYMLAILCARSGRIEQGLKFYSRACAADPALEYRGNLDPEIQFLLRRQDREE